VEQVFPPTGRTTSATQTHWFRIADGKVNEHWGSVWRSHPLSVKRPGISAQEGRSSVKMGRV
jgi:hypothetical protein